MAAADQYEQQMLALINAERAQLGLQALTLNSRLNSSAEIHSEWMLTQDVFSHTGVNGTDAGDRMQAADYVFSGTWSWGENIAWTSQGGANGIADEVANLHIALMNSPGHRANILNATYKEIGIGVEVGMFTTSGGQTYSAVMITQNFALSAADNGGDGGSAGGGTGGTGSGGGVPPVVTLLPVGTAASETLMGTIDADAVDGLGGNDAIFGLAGDDTLIGGIGNDKLYGGDDDDDLSGGHGNDLLQGDLGDDLLSGGDGNDKAYGGEGQDTLLGDAGNDFLVGGAGNDSMDGGIGNDKLYGEADNDALSGGAGADRLDGGDGDDDLYGGSENDRLAGGFGNDTLSGDQGDDRLEGGDGNDDLSGDAGIDRLTGGLGEDNFIFVDGFGADRVMDFVNDVDTLVFDGTYWEGIEDAATFVDTYAEVVGSKVIFDFGDGDVLTVSGVRSLELLYDDVLRII